MELTPNDIRNFDFPTQLRGYDKEAVDNFKEQVAITHELLKQENMKLSMEIDSVKTQLAGLKQYEDLIKNAAIDARRNADQTVAAAQKQAEELVARAQAQVEEITSTRFVRRDQLQQEITQLELTRKSYLNQLHTLITSHMEWVKELAISEGIERPGDERIEITDSKIVNRATRESLITEPSGSTASATDRVEDANAPGRIITPVQSDTDQLAESLKRVVTDEQGVDPELAEALDNYRKLAEKNSVKTHPAPEPNQLATDKMKQQKAAPTHDGPNLDVRIDSGAPNGDLADVLDSVASKFAEEMDKAAKG